MKFETYLLLGVILYGVWRTNRSVQRSQTAQKRYFAVRSSVFLWFVGVLLVGALLFLPNKMRILLLIPAFFGVVSLARFLSDARDRLRRQTEERVDLERMKRVN
jgi:hypothetical protein